VPTPSPVRLGKASCGLLIPSQHSLYSSIGARHWVPIGVTAGAAHNTHAHTQNSQGYAFYAYKYIVMYTGCTEYTSCINLFISVLTVPLKLMALALFTSISIPPNFSTACSTALDTWSSNLISTTQGRHLPPASSTICVHKY